MALRLEPLKEVEIEIQISPYVEGRESRAHNSTSLLNCVRADQFCAVGSDPLGMNPPMRSAIACWLPALAIFMRTDTGRTRAIIERNSLVRDESSVAIPSSRRISRFR